LQTFGYDTVNRLICAQEAAGATGAACNTRTVRIPTKKIAHSELMTIKIVAERRCQKVLCSR